MRYRKYTLRVLDNNYNKRKWGLLWALIFVLMTAFIIYFIITGREIAFILIPFPLLVAWKSFQIWRGRA